LFDRRGAPLSCAVIARTDDGARVITGISGDHTDTLTALLDQDNPVVGRKGNVKDGADGFMSWSF